MPVIFRLPGRDGDIDARAMAAGAQDFLVKQRLDPFALERAIRYARLHSRTLATLRRSERSFRGLIENAPDAIFVHRGGRLIYVNPSVLNWLGYTDASELVGRS